MAGMTGKRSGFRALWLSQATSNLGDGLLIVAAPLLVASLTRDPVIVSGMTVVQFLPWLLFTLPAGALTDRVDRRKILLVGNLLRGLGFALLALSLIGGWRHVGLLYAAVFLAGTAETLVDNAALTIPPRLVPRDRLEQANGRLFATQSVVNTFIGPPVGAFLFATAASLVFFTGAGLFAMAGLAALFLPQLLPASDSQSKRAHSVGPDIRAGWAHFWGHKLLRRVAFISAAINFFGAATGALLVLLATGPYGVSAAGYALFITVPAAGAILGSLIAEKVVPAVGGGVITWAAALIPAVSYIVLGVGTHTPMALIALFLAAVATSCNQIVVSTLRQAAVPDHLLGRVTAAYRFVVLGVVPFGALAGGILAQTLGLRAPFLAAGVGLTLAAFLLASRVTTSALRQAESDNSQPLHAGEIR